MITVLTDEEAQTLRIALLSEQEFLRQILDSRTFLHPDTVAHFEKRADAMNALQNKLQPNVPRSAYPIPQDQEQIMAAMDAAVLLKKLGILFVPIPVLSVDDHSTLKRDQMDRMQCLAESVA